MKKAVPSVLCTLKYLILSTLTLLCNGCHMTCKKIDVKFK